MKYCYLFVLLLLLGFSCPLSAENWHGMTLPEEALYSISYLGIPAGSASIRVEKISYEGKPAIQISAQIWSSRYYSKIYRVDDKVVSILDPETLKPFEHYVDYEEGSYRRKTRYVFDYEKGECRSEEGAFAIPEKLLDPAGALFFIRMQDLENNKKFEENVCDGRRVQTLTAEVTSIKKIATMWDWKKSYVVQPDFKDIRKEGVTAVRQKVTIFFLKDKEKIPYLVKGRLLIGSIVARLKELKKE